MARSTPTYTPPGKYVLGCLLSIALLFTDINYQTFSSFRGLTQATGIYSQLILKNLFDYTVQLNLIYQDKKNLIAENQKLHQEILLIQNKQFLDIQSQRISQELESVQQMNKLFQIKKEKSYPALFPIASFDLKNYLCCSAHTMHLKNPNKLEVEQNIPVVNGNTFVGQTSGMDLNLIKVILLSDISHSLPIKINEFHCNASGAGKPLYIICNIPQTSQELNLEIDEPVYTSGMGGIFPKNVLIGRINSFKNTALDDRQIVIKLVGDPLKQNYFGLLFNL